MIKMRKHRLTRLYMFAPVIVFTVLAIFVITYTGCGNSRQEVEEIDAAFRNGSSQLDQTTAFQGALEDFDFENANFQSNALSQIEASRAAAAAVLTSLDELGEFEYDGTFKTLGGEINDYRQAMFEAIGELENVYNGLEDILRAIEPALNEEAVITQLEAPQSNEEWLSRLKKLEAALSEAISALQQTEVTPLLAEYKSLFMDIFETMHKLAVDLIATVSGQIPNVELNNNPDFMRIQDLQASYLPLVQGLYDKLKINGIDPLIEKVELEINRLYLGGGAGN
jgi:hypothetical protein